MRVIVGVTGATGAPIVRRFLERCPGDTYLIMSQWGRAVMHLEMGLRPEDLDPLVTQRFADTDLSAPLASGSNAFDAYVILPCTTNTMAKIAAGISDTLITRCAHVALKERRRLILCVRETPWTTIDCQNALTLSQAGAIIAPLSPPMYVAPGNVSDIVEAFTDRLLSLLGEPMTDGWRCDELA